MQCKRDDVVVGDMMIPPRWNCPTEECRSVVAKHHLHAMDSRLWKGPHGS